MTVSARKNLFKKAYHFIKKELSSQNSLQRNYLNTNSKRQLKNSRMKVHLTFNVKYKLTSKSLQTKFQPIFVQHLSKDFFVYQRYLSSLLDTLILDIIHASF